MSVYAPWERPLGRDKRLWADASAHRVLSDLTPLLWDQGHHSLVVAGDFNILYGYGELGNPHWARYAGVFERAEALGLVFVGPQYPNGHQARPWPDELPPDSRNIPTFRYNDDGLAGARRQLDFVFVSEALRDRVRVTALNGADDWGPSDHCRIVIDVEALSGASSYVETRPARLDGHNLGHNLWGGRSWLA